MVRPATIRQQSLTGVSMSEENFLSLQPSESVIANMASRIFAAYLQKGEVNDSNADEYIKKSTRLAIKIANYTDTVCKSDGEWMVEKNTGAASLL
jgi:hypothetical protein